MAFLFDPRFQALDANGMPLSGANLTFYRAGTTTKISIYMDSGATTPHANPVSTDSSGTFPAIFLATVEDYKFILKNASGVTVQTVDNIPVNEADLETITDAAAAAATAAGEQYVDEAEAARNEAVAAAASIAGLSATSIQGRLSLTSGMAAPESDVTGATSIYYVPNQGQYVPVYDGTSFVSRSVGAGLTLALDADTGHSAYQASGEIYDLYAIYDSGTLRLATGHPWSGGTSPGSDTARGTGVGGAELETFNGILVNKVGMTARFGSGSGDTVVVPARYGTYLGTFMATGNGEATDSRLKRLLFNAYNRTMKDFRVREATASWTYDGETVRQANGSTANQVEILLGLSGTLVQANLVIVNAHTDPVSNTYFAAGIGVDSTTAYHDDCAPAAGFFGAESKALMHNGLYKGYPGLGYHVLTWLENGPGEITDETLTWYGSGFKSGIYGSFLG